jgi:hypothetical protein
MTNFQQFVLDLLQIQSLSLKHHIDEFTTVQKNYLREIVTTFDKCYKEVSERVFFKGWFLRFLEDDPQTHIDFYTIKAFPLFKSVQKTMRITVSQKRLTLLVRGLPVDITDEQMISFNLSKTPPYLYKMIYTAKSAKLMPEIINYNLGISSLNVQPFSLNTLRMLLSESRISSFDILLQTLLNMQKNKEVMSFNNINSRLEENGVMRSPQKFISVAVRYFTHYILENPLEFSYTDRTLSLKEVHIPIIENALSNYQRKLSPGISEFHMFKRVLLSRCPDSIKLQFMDNPKIAKLYLNTEQLRPSRKQFLEVALREQGIRIELTLNLQYNLSREILENYKTKDADSLPLTLKETKHNIKLGITFPYNTLADLDNSVWQDSFVLYFNRFIEYVMPLSDRLYLKS